MPAASQRAANVRRDGGERVGLRGVLGPQAERQAGALPAGRVGPGPWPPRARRSCPRRARRQDGQAGGEARGRLWHGQIAARCRIDRHPATRTAAATMTRCRPGPRRRPRPVPTSSVSPQQSRNIPVRWRSHTGFDRGHEGEPHEGQQDPDRHRDRDGQQDAGREPDGGPRDEVEHADREERSDRARSRRSARAARRRRRGAPRRRPAQTGSTAQPATSSWERTAGDHQTARRSRAPSQAAVAAVNPAMNGQGARAHRGRAQPVVVRRVERGPVGAGEQDDREREPERRHHPQGGAQGDHQSPATSVP